MPLKPFASRHILDAEVEEDSHSRARWPRQPRSRHGRVSRVRRPRAGPFRPPRMAAGVRYPAPSRVRRPRAGIATLAVRWGRDPCRPVPSRGYDAPARALRHPSTLIERGRAIQVAGTTPPRGHFDRSIATALPTLLVSRGRRPLAGIWTALTARITGNAPSVAGISTSPRHREADDISPVAGTTPPRGEPHHVPAHVAGTTPPRGHFDPPEGQRDENLLPRSRVRRPRAGISTLFEVLDLGPSAEVAGTTPPRGHFDSRLPRTCSWSRSCRGYDAPARGHFDWSHVSILVFRYPVAGTTPPRGHFDGIRTGVSRGDMVAGTTPPRGHFDGRTGGQGSSCLMSRVRRPRAGISTGCHQPRRRTPHPSRVRRPRAGISTRKRVCSSPLVSGSRVRRPRAGISTGATAGAASCRLGSR